VRFLQTFIDDLKRQADFVGIMRDFITHGSRHGGAELLE
jgi:hypothetical protein